MDFIEGVPLSRCVIFRPDLVWIGAWITHNLTPPQPTPLNPPHRLKETMKERGIEEGSPESAIFGRRLLNALTEAYARMLVWEEAIASGGWTTRDFKHRTPQPTPIHHHF